MLSPILLMRTAALKLVLGLLILLIIVFQFCIQQSAQYSYGLWNWTCRMEGGIPPLVELLEFTDTKVQRAAAGALRTLAFKNDENKNQVIGLSLVSLTFIRLVV